MIETIKRATSLFCKDYRFSYDNAPVTVHNLDTLRRVNIVKSRLFLKHTRPNYYPLFPSIELTNYCNLKCPVCPTGTGIMTRKRQAMNPALFQEIWRELDKFALTCCLWNWGEPLLHPEIGAILKIASNSRTATILSTNGQNLNSPKVIDALVRYPVQRLIVALDGITDETLSVYRVGAKLAPALEGVEAIRHHRKGKYPILDMRFIAMKHNEHEIPYLKLWATTHGFDLLSIRTLSECGSSLEDNHSSLTPKDEKYQGYEYKYGIKQKNDNFSCQKIFMNPCIDVNGEVTPCEQDYQAEITYGNVKDNTFCDIWFGDKARTIRENILKDRNIYYMCRECIFADRKSVNCTAECHELRGGYGLS